MGVDKKINNRFFRVRSGGAKITSRKDWRETAFTSKGEMLRHAHGCIRCRARYEDTCSDPVGDGLCRLCASDGTNVDPWWPEARLPRECCMEDSKRLNPDWKGDRATMKSYKLAGRGPWWQCSTCGRTHPFDPAQSPATYPAVTAEEWHRRNA